MPADLQMALVGYGMAGRVFHAPLIQHTPGVALHSVVSSRRDALRRQFTDVRVCADVQQVLDDPCIDGVVLATPNALHAPLALRALAAGKHVLVDKPFALNAVQAGQVLDAADTHQRVATAFQNRRYDADFLTLRQLLAQGTLGEIAECHVHFDRFRPQVRDRWREHDAPGGGLWLDLGPHLLDQMLQLFGWPDAITADLDCQRGSGGVDYFHAVLHYPRMRAVLHAGSLVTAPTPRYRVHGHGGSWIKHGQDVQESQLAAGIAPGAPGWGLDPRHGELCWHDAHGQLQQRRTDTLHGDYRAVYARLAEAMHGVGPPEVTAPQILQLAGLLDAGQCSAREGRRIDLPAAPG